MGSLPWFEITLAATIGLLLVDRQVERVRLHSFISSLGPSPLDLTQCALELGSRISNLPARPDPLYITRLLEPLGATPSTVIRHGGCCSGKARLYILCLEVLGIRAHQITVYHLNGNAQHCLVEVQLPEGKLISDPLYGVCYVDSSGRFLGLEDLQAGAQVTFRPLPGTTQNGYPKTSYYDFDYAATKTANWTKSWPRRFAYAALWLVMGRGVDRLRVPAILEWPQVLLSILIVGSIACYHGAFVLVYHLGAI